MHRRKKLLMAFKVFLKNKWKHRKLGFNRSEEIAFLIEKKWHVFISVTYLVAQNSSEKPI